MPSAGGRIRPARRRRTPDVSSPGERYSPAANPVRHRGPRDIDRYPAPAAALPRSRQPRANTHERTGAGLPECVLRDRAATFCAACGDATVTSDAELDGSLSGFTAPTGEHWVRARKTSVVQPIGGNAMSARITKIFAATTIALALGVVAAPTASAQAVPVIPGLGSVEVCVGMGSVEVCI